MIEYALFAAGCFWGVQAAFDVVPGVLETQVGYIGGTVAHPTYEQVCTDTTGHAEAVQIKYDSTVVTYDHLLDIFFDNHNPTTLNQQGPDIGTQYRSAIFYLNDSQKNQALNKIKELDNKHIFGRPIVTEVVPATDFYPAEEYHQKYLEKKGRKSCFSCLFK